MINTFHKFTIKTYKLLLMMLENLVLLNQDIHS
jgi:hypothetical protein